MQWIIRTDCPFKGHAQSILREDGTVEWTDGLTLEEYERERGIKCRAIDDAEMQRLVAAHEETLVTEPQPITKADYWDALECLPPCRWHWVDAFEVFHVSERLTGNLVAWYAQRENRYWQWTDYADIPDATILKRLTGAYPAPLPTLKYRNPDPGNCRVYYTARGKAGGMLLYCYQKDGGESFALYRCSMDGEPDYPCRWAGNIEFPAEHTGERIDDELRAYLQATV